MKTPERGSFVMWTNQMLKKNAWNSLKGYYWWACLVTFVASILGGSSGGARFNFNFNYNTIGSGSTYPDSSGGFSDIDGAEVAAFMLIMTIVWIVAMAAAFAISAFLGNVVRVGQCKYFYEARNGRPDFNNLFANFKGGKYMATVKTMFYQMLYIFLWSLLFIIPGIIKSYEYFLIPYMLAENPHLSKERAFEISKRTMNGEKGKLFVLGLSFIGWAFLGALACGVGVYFVMPYMEATMAEFYTCMRAKMLAYGYTTEEELTGNLLNDNYGGFNNFGGNGGYGNNQMYGNNAYGSNAYGNTNYGGSPYNNGQGNDNNPYNS